MKPSKVFPKIIYCFADLCTEESPIFAQISTEYVNWIDAVMVSCPALCSIISHRQNKHAVKTYPNSWSNKRMSNFLATIILNKLYACWGPSLFRIFDYTLITKWVWWSVGYKGPLFERFKIKHILNASQFAWKFILPSFPISWWYMFINQRVWLHKIHYQQIGHWNVLAAEHFVIYPTAIETNEYLTNVFIALNQSTDVSLCRFNYIFKGFNREQN